MAGDERRTENSEATAQAAKTSADTADFEGMTMLGPFTMAPDQTICLPHGINEKLQKTT